MGKYKHKPPQQVLL